VPFTGEELVACRLAPDVGSCTRRRPTGGQRQLWGIPACRRRRSGGERSLVTVERIVDELRRVRADDIPVG